MLTPSNGRLRVPLDRLRRLDAEDVEDRRHEVDRVVVLVADLAAGLRPGRPRDDARVARAAVELVALPHLERRVERHRPAVRVVVVRLRAAELVDHAPGSARGRRGRRWRTSSRSPSRSGPPSPLAPLSETTTMIVFSSCVVLPRGSRAGARCGGRRAPRNPAYTSAIRANSRFSSSFSESHGRVTSSIGNGLPSGPRARLGRPIGLIGGSSVSAGTMPSFFWLASVCSRIAS